MEPQRRNPITSMNTKPVFAPISRWALVIVFASLASAAVAGLTSRFEQNGQGKPAGAGSSPETYQLAPAQAGARLTNAPLPPMLKAQAPAPLRSLPAWATNASAEEIVVKLKKGTKGALLLQDKARRLKDNLPDVVEAAQLGSVFSKHGITSMTSAFARARGARANALKGKAASKRDELFRWCRVPLPKGADREKVLADLRSHHDVELAEPAHEYRLADSGIPDVFTDADMSKQWHLDACRAQDAWRFLQSKGIPAGGSRDVVVAVIDTGVDYTHPELIGNMWSNPREITGNGIDDDGNGFVDDIHGCSVVSDARSHSGDCQDQNGHGTHVAGIIAAQAFNHNGGVGVAFNVQIMAVRAGQSSGVFSDTDISEGILYAVDNGAEVINMSFGGYSRSQIMEDALAVALNQAVLVAAAGNGANDVGQSIKILPFYPAALPYVLGVMATKPDNALCGFSNYGYAVRAPGESIYSTLPGNRYAAWSGTSMAAPIVSGLAALLRSYHWQRDVYSSRYLMGAVINGGIDVWGDQQVIDAFQTVSTLPSPSVVILENWLFDDKGINPRNDADGRVDSGETIHLAIELMNKSGQASNVVATLAARDPTAWNGDPGLYDPYVTFITNTVSYGNIGAISTADNGLLRDPGNVVIGVQRPFVFQVANDCPNDHLIVFELTTTYADGWNPSSNSLSVVSTFEYVVQRGRNVPTVVSTNTVLSADDFWIVGGPVLVDSGATLTIAPGTKVQWGSVSDDPYNPGPQAGNIIVRGTLNIAGTSNQPVALFPSELVGGQVVNVAVASGGTADMAYAKVRGASLSGFRVIDHCYFDADNGGGAGVSAEQIKNTLFHKLRSGGVSAFLFGCCLFDAGWITPTPPNSPIPRLINCTFLQDNENNHPISLTAAGSIYTPYFGGVPADLGNPTDKYTMCRPVSRNGFTYVTLPAESTDYLQQAELIAQYFGGHVTSVADQEEQTFLQTYLSEPTGGTVPAGALLTYYIGLTDEGSPGQYHWLDGSPLNYVNWDSGFPVAHSELTALPVAIANFVGGYGYRPVPWLGPWHNLSAGASRINGFYADGLAFILKLPGSWTAAQLNTQITNGNVLSFVRSRMQGTMIYNAFLSKYWDTALTHWMRVVAGGGDYASMNFNYWGTTNTTLINYMILDYYDGSTFTGTRVDYAPPALHGYPSTYPFVEKVLIGGTSAETVPQLSAGRVDFQVIFNRDMNTNIEPFVTFGPSPPYTDFSVLPRDDEFVQTTNGWSDARTWQGSAWITPVTGNSYHLMRISDAVAADDPWLSTGYDVGRFRFKVATTAVASMALQAEGLEGAVHLMWQQNDYDLLAGYNLYRSTDANGTYVKLNATVIPPGYEDYLDTNVVPAVPMFYKFTVLSTDFQESDASGVASAAALDTIPPTISHVAVSSALPAQGLHLTAVASDNLRIVDVTAYYRPTGGSNYNTIPMVNVSTTNWSVTIPGSAVQPPGLDYYLVASDGISQAYSGTPLLPHAVTVSAVPTLSSVTPNQGPASGGTQVTLAGTLFDAGSTVSFGGVLAGNVVLVTANQLTCLTPPHFPALVDVSVNNTNGTSATLLNGFRYVDAAAVVSLPATNGNYGSEIEVPLSAANVTGLRAGSIAITFNPSVLSFLDVRLGALTAGWSVSYNQPNSGRVLISLASPSAVTGSGSLAILRFSVVGSPTSTSSLSLESVLLNDGAITASRGDGSFTVNGFFTLTGTVGYYNGGSAVPGAELSLAGTGNSTASTGTNGTFIFTNVPTGAYTLTASKTNDVAEITAYDAALVLQASVGLVTLSANQVLAADVNRNGLVSAMDASYILEKAVGLIEGPFPGAGKVWDFVPATRSYSLLNSDQSGQDFTAILLGDVSGNWTLPADQAGSQLQVRTPRRALPFGAESPRPADVSGDSVVIGKDNGLLPAAAEKLARVLMKATNSAVYGIDLVLSYTPTNGAVTDLRLGSLAGTGRPGDEYQRPGLAADFAGQCGAHCRRRTAARSSLRSRGPLCLADQPGAPQRGTGVCAAGR